MQPTPLAWAAGSGPAGGPVPPPRLEAAEVLAHALTYGLERLEAIRTLGGVDADTLRGAMIDSDKDGDLAISHGCCRGQVRAPHLVDPLGCDGAIVSTRTTRGAFAMRREQTILAAEAEHTAFGGAQSSEAQPRPDFAIAFTVKGTVGQHLADGGDEVGVGRGALWSGSLWRCRPGSVSPHTLAIEARPPS